MLSHHYSVERRTRDPKLWLRRRLTIALMIITFLAAAAPHLYEIAKAVRDIVKMF
jgi:hypothetical protein